MSLTQNEQPWEAFSPASPENPLFHQKKQNQAGRTSQRDPAIASSQVMKPLCPHRSWDLLPHPETSEPASRNSKMDLALIRGLVQEAPCSPWAQDSPLLPRDMGTARGYSNEIPSQPFPTNRHPVAQPKKNIFCSLKQHQQEAVEALVVQHK